MRRVVVILRCRLFGHRPFEVEVFCSGSAVVFPECFDVSSVTDRELEFIRSFLKEEHRKYTIRYCRRCLKLLRR